ncbi:MAG TPA: transporter [Gemmatimonadaceae bacterium]
MSARRVRRAAFLIALATPAGAQEGVRDPRAVQPERPTVATHAHTVAPGYVEIEAGTQGQSAGDGSRSYFAPIVTKVGLTSHLQLNLVTPASLGGAGQSAGVGDVGIGVKWRLLDDHPLLGDFAILPFVKLPTGSLARGTGSGTTDVGVTLISSYELGPVSMDLNVGYTRIGASSDASASDAGLWTASFGLPVAGRLSWVAELFGLPMLDRSAPTSPVALLTGPSFLIDRAFNVDAGVIAPLRGGLPNAIYAGFVWNVGRLR